MSKFKPTKELMLTPRDCRHCGQHMSAELLARRRYKRAERISEALKDYDRRRKAFATSPLNVNLGLPKGEA